MVATSESAGAAGTWTTQYKTVGTPPYHSVYERICYTVVTYDWSKTWTSCGKWTLVQGNA